MYREGGMGGLREDPRLLLLQWEIDLRGQPGIQAGGGVSTMP